MKRLIVQNKLSSFVKIFSLQIKHNNYSRSIIKSIIYEGIKRVVINHAYWSKLGLGYTPYFN
jgi:hypothetical protein